MAGGEDISERERAILAAVVELHIDSKEPVGSKTLTSSLDLGVSPATVRSIMASLDEKGLIAKPHTSAGRVPTDRGLRFYVDTLLRLEEPPAEATREIQSRVVEARTLDSAMEEAGRVLSRLSRQACLIRAPRPDGTRLKHIELVPLREGSVLAILVSEAGLVQNRLLQLGPELKKRLAGVALLPETLARMGHYLTDLAQGLTLEQLLVRLRADVQHQEDQVLVLAQQLAEELGQDGLEPRDLPLLVEGRSHLLQGADPASLEKLRELYAVLEEKEQLVHLLDDAQAAPGVRIFIGQESGLGELAQMSLVTATYGNGTDIFGSVGVLGPMHMDYGRVVPLVSFTAEAVTGLLKG